MCIKLHNWQQSFVSIIILFSKEIELLSCSCNPIIKSFFSPSEIHSIVALYLGRFSIPVLYPFSLFSLPIATLHPNSPSPNSPYQISILTLDTDFIQTLHTGSAYKFSILSNPSDNSSSKLSISQLSIPNLYPESPSWPFILTCHPASSILPLTLFKYSIINHPNFLKPTLHLQSWLFIITTNFYIQVANLHLNPAWLSIPSLDSDSID